MKNILVGVLLGVIIAGFSVSTVYAARYGAQIIRGSLVGYTEKNDSEIYKWTDGTATCYILYFGKSGATMDCK